MKIAVWAMRKRDEQATIQANVSHLILNDVDVVVLTGCRTVAELQSSFIMMGFKNVAFYESGPQSDTVIIASRSNSVISASAQVSSLGQIYLEVYLPEHELSIIGVQFPDTSDIRVLDLFCQRLTGYIGSYTDSRKVLVGNFSIRGSNLNAVLDFKRSFQNIASLGWLDAWRYLHPITYEQIWFSKAKEGVCLDFVMLSPPLTKLLTNAYHSQIRPDSKPASRVLIVELELKRSQGWKKSE